MSKISKYFKKLEDNRVQCTLCPKKCRLNEGQKGVCMVRKNIKGELHSLNYGFLTFLVVEPIETNGVFNYLPGEKTLAVGSIGCNLNCSFCQAWKYTKKIDMESKCFAHYTPEEIVEKVEKLGLKAIAWTFNDPISSFEFILDTAKIAKEKGIISIFKSSHYLNEEPLKDMMQHVEVFSVSLKSIRDEFYKKLCQGDIEPVKNAIKIIKSNNKYLEICNLVIPEHNNSDADLNDLAEWVKENAGVETPLHFARFHPDYKLTDVPRTSSKDLARARKIALDKGFKYVYTGNIFVDEGLNTYCPECKNLLIERKGERINILNKSREVCDKCKKALDIKFGKNKNNKENIIEYSWDAEIWAVHLQLENKSDKEQTVVIEHQFKKFDKKNMPTVETIQLDPKGKVRHTISMINEDHFLSKFISSKDVKMNIFENLDRAYYDIGE